MTAAPRLETARLVLRPHRLEDFPAMAAFLESDSARFIGGPLPLRRAWHCFGSDVGSWDLMGFGCWAIEEKDSGAFAGQVGLNKPPFFPEREIGWLLLPGFEGKGYATEAALAARAFAYGALGWSTAVSYCDCANLRSIAVARRLGCVEDPEAERLDPEDIVFRHPPPEVVA
jgi:RimJ/RimL family protein N-acetyltransferase